MLDSVSARTDSWQTRCLIVGAIGLVITLVIGFFAPADAFAGYLVGYTFWWAIGIGSLGLMILYHLTGGAWGVMLKPAIMSGVSTVPLLAVLFLPIAFGVGVIYPWLNEEYIAEHSYLMGKKDWYLNLPFFYGRAIFYFAIWILFSLIFPRPKVFPRAEAPSPLRGIAAVSMLVFVSTVTFAAFDWLMTLDPLWYSTIFGLLAGIGGILTAFALCTIASYCVEAETLPNTKPMEEVQIDVGSLQFAFIMLWGYFSLSQFLIIWSANYPDEAFWYIQRSTDAWQFVTVILVLLHFVVPFSLLLSRDTKRSPKAMIRVCSLLLTIHLVEIVWTTMPSTQNTTWLSIVTVLSSVAGVGGIWGWWFCRSFGDRIDSYPEIVRDVLVKGADHSVGHHSHTGTEVTA